MGGRRKREVSLNRPPYCSAHGPLVMAWNFAGD